MSETALKEWERDYELQFSILMDDYLTRTIKYVQFKSRIRSDLVYLYSN